MQVPPFTVAGAAEQLARTDELLRAVGAGDAPATLRWYGYDAPAVILGVGQPRDVVDEAACRAMGVAVVKRASGGTVVFAGPTLLALDVALPSSHPLAGHDVIEAYRWVGETFRNVLASLVPEWADRIMLVELPTARKDQQGQREAAPDTGESLRALACFGVLSPYEVGLVRGESWHPAGDKPLPHAAGGKTTAKLVGLSQIRKRGVVMFQAGVYTGVDTDRFAAWLAVADSTRPALAAELRRRMAALDELGLSERDVPRLMEAVDRQIAHRAPARLSAAGRGGGGGR